MYFNKAKCSTALLVFWSALSSTSFAGGMGAVTSHFKGHFLAQIGGYSAIQGKEQHINVQENLVGNFYTIKTHNQGSGLVGVGYFLDGPVIYDRFSLSYGVDAFFLGRTSVSGYIVQENLFTNLAYSYRMQNIPLYFAAKTVVDTNNDKFKLAFDAGIGPNFMNVGHYNETPLNGFTVPDNAFSDRNNVTFAATAGASVRFNNGLEQLPIECGYRFFYLGEGEFNVKNHQAINALKTGDVYANAIACTVTI